MRTSACTQYTLSLRQCVHKSVLPGGIIICLCGRDFRPVRKLQTPNSAIHPLLLPLFGQGSQTDSITIRSCYPLVVLSPVSPCCLHLFSFPHCAVHRGSSSCLYGISFLCHMTNPEEFWYSVGIPSDPSLIWYLLTSPCCPRSATFPFRPSRAHTPGTPTGRRGEADLHCTPHKFCMCARLLVCGHECWFFFLCKKPQDKTKETAD